MSKLIIAVALLLGALLIVACASEPTGDAQSKEVTTAPPAPSPVKNSSTPGGTETATFALG